jgi:rhamnosyltransferase subunit B
MRAILTPVGSAGDVNPFVVVGRELRRRGHRVTLIAPDVFADVVANAGLEFSSSGSRDEFDRATANPDLWNARKGLSVVLGLLTSQLRRAYALIEQTYVPHETILVGHALSLFTRVFEEKHRTPAVTLHLAPSIFRSDFRQPILPTGGDISSWPRWAKRLFWWAVDRFGVDPLIAPALNEWRAELGLPPVWRVFESWIHSPARVLGLFPDWFGDPQPDWPPQLRLTGFALSDESCSPVQAATDAQPALEQFLVNGDAPVVFTPGSANEHAAEFFRTAIDATARLRRRALLVTGYRSHVPASLPAHAHHASYASFATLFPRAAAVVHHGGIGTCGQGLAAGVPQLIMPIGFDQPDNAARLTRLGVATIVRSSRFTASRVAEELGRLLASDDVRTACGDCQRRIRAHDGVSLACDEIELTWQRQRR